MNQHEQNDYSNKVGFTIGLLEQLIEELEDYPAPDQASYGQYADAIRLYGMIKEIAKPITI